MIHIKSQRELNLMREAGKRVAYILQKISQMVEPGIGLDELNAAADRLCNEVGGRPAFKGYLGFQHSLCTSVNEQVVHGIPHPRDLREGDIIGLDFGLVYDGFYGDSAITIPVGKVSAPAKKLMKTTIESLYAGIGAARSGSSLKDIARAIEAVITPCGYGIVREFVGHGIGTKLHEDPQVPNYSEGASLLTLKNGMTIAIEPMINEGSAGVRILDDKWTAVTVDGKLSAHYEHTIAITNGEPEILTEWQSPYFGGITETLDQG